MEESTSELEAEGSAAGVWPGISPLPTPVDTEPPPPPGRSGGPAPLHRPNFAAGVTDYRSVPERPMGLPAAGGSFIDPDFGTRIIRVTDGARTGVSCVNSYSYVPAFNLDSTRMVLACGGVAQIYLFDGQADTARFESTLTEGLPYNINWESAFWSGVDANVLFVLGGDRGRGVTKLYRVDVTQHGAGRFQVVRDFAGLWPGNYALWQLGKSDDDNVFTFHTREGSSRRVMAAYLRASNQVLTFPESGFIFDESQVDKLGRHVFVIGRDRDSYTIKMWNPVTNQVVKTLMPGAADNIGGHYDLGSSLMVNGDRYHTGAVMRTFADPKRPRNVLRYLHSDGATLNWSIADHLSMRNADESHFVGSTYGSWDGRAPFGHEIYLAKTDGSGFSRIAHTRSRGTADPYWSEPRASADRSGRFVAFSSDFGRRTIDVFVVRVP